MIERDLDKVEESLEKITELYDGVVEAMPREEQRKAMRGRDLSYNSSDNWIRGARAKVRRHTQEAPPRSQGASRSHLQRVSLPTFSGKAEDWPEFRRHFLELTAEE